MWKPVLGYESLYEASSDGKIRRKIGPQCHKERVLKPAIDRRGYERVKLSKDCLPITHNVHKLIAEAFLGPMPLGMTVNHKDCNKRNNNVGNLEYMTRAENTKHATLNGRISLSNAKLTPEQVLDIRQRFVPRNGSCAILAEEYGVSKKCIQTVASLKHWRHIS